MKRCVVHVLLPEPEWIFMDDATAAFDEAMEKRVYEILAARLPAAAVMSTTHRPAAAQYHARRWTTQSNDEGPASLQTT